MQKGKDRTPDSEQRLNDVFTIQKYCQFARPNELNGSWPGLRESFSFRTNQAALTVLMEKLYRQAPDAHKPLESPSVRAASAE